METEDHVQQDQGNGDQDEPDRLRREALRHACADEVAALQDDLPGPVLPLQDLHEGLLGILLEARLDCAPGDRDARDELLVRRRADRLQGELTQRGKRRAHLGDVGLRSPARPGREIDGEGVTGDIRWPRQGKKIRGRGAPVSLERGGQAGNLAMASADP